jgi:hypothetical protein
VGKNGGGWWHGIERMCEWFVEWDWIVSFCRSSLDVP